MDTHHYHIHLKWLQDNGFLAVIPGRPKLFTIKDEGRMALFKRDTIGRLWEYAEMFRGATSFKQEMEVLSLLFRASFRFAYRNYKDGNVNTYLEFLSAVEDESYLIVNENVSDILDGIRKGKIRGHLEDPYYSIIKRSLPALYFDARLARRLGHYLTVNHRFVLMSASEATEEEMSKCNKAWIQRFNTEEIPGENDQFASQWRFNPTALVIRELKIRGDSTLFPEDASLRRRRRANTYREISPAFYEAASTGRLHRRNSFEVHHPDWRIDFNRAEAGFEWRRRLERYIEFGVIPETRDKLKSMADYTEDIVNTPDGLIARFTDEKGKLIKEIPLKIKIN